MSTLYATITCALEKKASHIYRKISYMCTCFVVSMPEKKDKQFCIESNNKQELQKLLYLTASLSKRIIIPTSKYTQRFAKIIFPAKLRSTSAPSRNLKTLTLLLESSVRTKYTVSSLKQFVSGRERRFFIRRSLL